jgi:hypothetical protein
MWSLAPSLFLVIGDGRDHATPERFLELDELIADDREKAIDEVRIDKNSCIVVLMYSSEYDELALGRFIE